MDILELAAKAHGNLEYVEDLGWIHVDDQGNRGSWWNPRDNDGDALRLAVKLNISVFPVAEETFWNGSLEEYEKGPFVCCLNQDDQCGIYVKIADDINLAVRYCILLAAAKIKRGKFQGVSPAYYQIGDLLPGT